MSETPPLLSSQNTLKEMLYERLPEPLVQITSMTTEVRVLEAAYTVAAQSSRVRLALLGVVDGDSPLLYPDELELFEKLLSIPARFEIEMGQIAIQPTPEGIASVLDVEEDMSLRKQRIPSAASWQEQPLYALYCGYTGFTGQLEDQVRGGFSTARKVYGLLSADLYRHLLDSGVAPDERPEIANELLASKGFLATLLLLARGMHRDTHTERVSAGTGFRPITKTLPSDLQILRSRSPLTVSARDINIGCLPNLDSLAKYWVDREEIANGTRTLGCPAGRAHRMSDDMTPDTAIGIFSRNLTQLVIASAAFQAYEGFLLASRQQARSS